MSTSDKSYLGKAILFVVLSIVAFLIFKNILPPRLFPEHTIVTENIIIDSMALEAQNDTLAIEEIPVAEPDSTQVKPKENETDNKEGDSVREQLPDPVKEIDTSLSPSLSADGYQNLKRFYAKLHQLEQDKSGSVRIGYFGDSMNDGDYIVQDVRSEFQSVYGGEGVGFVSVSSLSAGSRGSVSHQYSKNWFSQSFVRVKKPMRAFGIDGQVFFAKDPADTYWVRYKAQAQPHSKMLNNPTLFYGSSRNGNASVTVRADKDSVSVKSLNPSSILNALKLTSHSARSLQVDFHKADSIPIYGFNFDDGKGVHIDNFSMRGNSGLPLSILSPALMNAFDRELGYDLIILHYGANVLGYGSLNYNWYEKAMTTVVNNLHKCFPNADILIISTADKASKIDGEMQTDPAVTALANAQKNYARKTGSGYINLYEVMGGNGSMVTWVNNKLANTDYTHFNATGSRKIAKLIYNEINKGYAKYKGSGGEGAAGD